MNTDTASSDFNSIEGDIISLERIRSADPVHMLQIFQVGHGERMVT